MIEKIKLAVFDMSGTTIKDNNEVLDCFYDALVETGIPREKPYINTMMGWSKIEVFRALWTEEMGFYTEGVEQRAQHSFLIFKKYLEQYYNTHNVEPTKGCLEIFDYLKSKHIKIALNTGFYRKVTDILLGKLGWTIGDTIDFSITSDEVAHGRPKPDMIQALMKHFALKNPEDVFKIGDTPSDLMEGRAAKCWTYGLTNGSHTHHELFLYDNDGLFESLETFLSFLKEKQWSASSYN
jgi:phosphonatase-like hydrolase